MLPTLTHPLFTVTIPSTKKQAKLRPMLVKEEKILLMAKESTDAMAVMLAVKQIVQNCIGDKVDIDNLTLFDIDYLFIQIRSNSIDPTIKVTVEKNGKPYEQIVNLSEVQVKFPEGVDKVIKFGKDQAITLKYPEAKLYESPELQDVTSTEKLIEELMFNCFESYAEKDKIYNFNEATREEALTFIDNLPVDVYGKVFKFFENMPHIFYEVKFKNEEGKEEAIPLTKLNDFFSF
jgi:hypothetical protein